MGEKNSTGHCVDITEPKGYGIIYGPFPEISVSYDFYFQSDITPSLKTGPFFN